MFAASIATLAIALADCLGCLRTREEAYNWREMTDDRRAESSVIFRNVGRSWQSMSSSINGGGEPAGWVRVCE
jgi:hypothetical protein